MPEHISYPDTVSPISKALETLPGRRIGSPGIDCTELRGNRHVIPTEIKD